MATIGEWTQSDDCVAVDSDGNGHGRGDGYDVDVFRSKRTGRYLVRVWYVPTGRASWYVAETIEGARAVGRHGYTPGHAPGKYRSVSRPERLREVSR